MLRKLGETMLEWIWPSDLYCVRCGEAIDPGREFSLCKKCAEEIQWVGESRCRRCGKPMGQFPGENPRLQNRVICSDCLRGRAIHRGYISLVYDGDEREMIHRFKFEGRPYYGAALAAMMAKTLHGEISADHLVVPVPMHREKMRRRGYDQAVILAKKLAKKMDLPYCGKALVRCRVTDPMMNLAGSGRARNVEDAFRVTERGFEKIAGRRILLVDDIYTSGSTADACAKVLLSAGAEKIYLAAAASGYGSWV